MAINPFRLDPPRTGRPAQLLRRRFFTAAAFALLGLSAALAVSHAAAGVVKLDKPVRVETVKSDNTRLAGRVALYDEEEFELTDDSGKSHEVKYSELHAVQAYDVLAALTASASAGSGTAARWLEAGKVLQRLPDGKAQAERAFVRALHADPGLKSAIDDARSRPDGPDGTAGTAAGSTARPSPRGGGGPELIKPLTGSPSGPLTIGAAQKQLWGKLPDADQADFVKGLKTFAEGTAKARDGSLKLQETKYFLFYSDLKPTEAANWAGLLDRMYARLAELFAVERGRNIWRGKALIFVFAKEADYYAYEHDSLGSDARGTAGMCTSFGDGRVLIAFYRQPQDLDFAHVLVHESVHGFVHRYRSPEHVPSWANEGLAEVIASELVPQPARADRDRQVAQGLLREHRSVDATFFTTAHIVDWQYPVAENLCAFMIAQNKPGYVKFINGIKDGLSTDEALEKQYGAAQGRLVSAYLSSMGVK